MWFSSETGNFVVGRTLHEVGTKFCRPNQTHRQVYREQIHSGSNWLRHQMGGSKGIAH